MTSSSGIRGDAFDIVEGDKGSDTLVFNGAGGNEIIAATADGGRVLFTGTSASTRLDPAHED